MIPLSLRRIALATLLALTMLFAWGLSTTSHYDAAEASWAHCHSQQGIHELSGPPASWPGTRAAHVVVTLNYPLIEQHFYTKSGWWDPTWDYYKVSYYVC